MMPLSPNCGAAMFFALCLTLVLLSEAKRCPPYPHTGLDHGTLHRVGFQRYTLECDEGHVLTSTNPTVRCFNGQWRPPSPPSCHKAGRSCPEPPRVADGRAVGEERHVGSVVTYICDEGYLLLGQSSLTCLRNEHWDGIRPSCMDESEPLQTVAERLQSSFVTKLENYSAVTKFGRSVDRAQSLGLELYLLIDRSSSVDPLHLEKGKNFMNHLLQEFAVRNTGNANEKGTRASVIAFGTDVQTVFGIDDETVTDFKKAASAVDTIKPNGGGTNMEGALTSVMLETPKLRPEAKRALFLMTDGEPNIANPEITPQDIALELKRNHKFEIFAVGIGLGINRFLLSQLASEPSLDHVFVIADYPDLDVVMKIIEGRKPPPPPVKKERCGANATGEEGPWLAALYVGGGPYKLCGGVLICSEWVLTAASCLQEKGVPHDKKDVSVVLGENKLLKSDKTQTNYYVTDIRLHPDFVPNSILNDLALLKLNAPASAIRPACLPPTDRVIPFHMDRSVEASLAGWGGASAAEVTYVRASDLTFQRNAAPVFLSGEEDCPMQHEDMVMLCAGQGSKSCYSLPGSPLMGRDPSDGFQKVLGIQVLRRRCSFGLNQYVELTEFVDWIDRETLSCQLKHK